MIITSLSLRLSIHLSVSLSLSLSLSLSPISLSISHFYGNYQHSTFIEILDKINLHSSFETNNDITLKREWLLKGNILYIITGLLVQVRFGLGLVQVWFRLGLGQVQVRFRLGQVRIGQVRLGQVSLVQVAQLRFANLNCLCISSVTILANSIYFRTLYIDAPPLTPLPLCVSMTLHLVLNDCPRAYTIYRLLQSKILK